MKKIISVCLVFFLLILSLCGCVDKDNGVTDEMFALDTIIRFTLYDEDKELCEKVIEDCKAEIIRLENMLSATKEGSDINTLNNANGNAVTVSDETAELLGNALKLCKNTDGAFDITVRPLVSAWGFDTKKYKVPTDEEIKKALINVSYKDVQIDGNTVTIKEGMAVDLGAVAKGYIGDKVRKVLLDSSVYSALVDMGGMIICKNVSKSPDEMFWNIGLSYPDDSGECFLKFKNSSPAISTSGGYQRYFEMDGVTYHHIIDSKTGKPAKSDISSVTVIDNDGYVCDALSTAFYVMGVDKTVEYLNTHKNVMGDRSLVLILSDDKNTLYASEEFKTYNLEPELLKGYEDIKIVYI